jgi:hypothetical protein
MHRLWFFKLDGEKIISLVIEVKGPFAVVAELNIHILKAISAGFVVVIYVDILIVILEEAVSPRPEKTLISDEALPIDRNILIEEGLHNGVKDDHQTLLIDIFEIFDFEKIFIRHVFNFDASFPLYNIGYVVKLEPNPLW